MKSVLVLGVLLLSSVQAFAEELRYSGMDRDNGSSCSLSITFKEGKVISFRATGFFTQRSRESGTLDVYRTTDINERIFRGLDTVVTGSMAQGLIEMQGAFGDQDFRRQMNAVFNVREKSFSVREATTVNGRVSSSVEIICQSIEELDPRNAQDQEKLPPGVKHPPQPEPPTANR